jgi:hypothetical protein
MAGGDGSLGVAAGSIRAAGLPTAIRAIFIAWSRPNGGVP